MTSHLVRHCIAARKARGLDIPQLARLAGYTNITRGCNRIRRFEERGEVHRDLLEHLANVLEIDEKTIAALNEQDRRDALQAWNEWADQPIEPRLSVPLLPGSLKGYRREELLPPGIRDLAAAEKYAAAISWSVNGSVCLVWSRRLSVWFDAAGKVASRISATPDKRPTRQLRSE